MSEEGHKFEAGVLLNLFGAAGGKQLFGQQLQALRKRSGLTQTQLASISATSRGVVADIEAGKANPTLDKIQAIVCGIEQNLDNS